MCASNDLGATNSGNASRSFVSSRMLTSCINQIRASSIPTGRGMAGVMGDGSQQAAPIAIHNPNHCQKAVHWPRAKNFGPQRNGPVVHVGRIVPRGKNPGGGRPAFFWPGPRQTLIAMLSSVGERMQKPGVWARSSASIFSICWRRKPNRSNPGWQPSRFRLLYLCARK